MSFGGSALAMMQTLKNNAKQLAKRKGYFDKNKPSYSTYGKFVDHKKMSPEDFEAFKLKLKKNELRRQIKLGVVSGIAVIIIVSTVVYFLYYS